MILVQLDDAQVSNPFGQTNQAREGILRYNRNAWNASPDCGYMRRRIQEPDEIEEQAIYQRYEITMEAPL